MVYLHSRNTSLLFTSSVGVYYQRNGHGRFVLWVPFADILCLFARRTLIDSTNDKSTPSKERWGAGVETQKYVRGDIGAWGRVPSNVKYHLRRGVGFIKFLENGTRPQPPTSPSK